MQIWSRMLCCSLLALLAGCSSCDGNAAKSDGGRLSDKGLPLDRKLPKSLVSGSPRLHSVHADGGSLH